MWTYTDANPADPKLAPKAIMVNIVGDASLANDKSTVRSILAFTDKWFLYIEFLIYIY